MPNTWTDIDSYELTVEPIAFGQVAIQVYSPRDELSVQVQLFRSEIDEVIAELIRLRDKQNAGKPNAS